MLIGVHGAVRIETDMDVQQKGKEVIQRGSRNVRWTYSKRKVSKNDELVRKLKAEKIKSQRLFVYQNKQGAYTALQKVKTYYNYYCAGKTINQKKMAQL